MGMLPTWEKGSHLPSWTTRFWQFKGQSWTVTAPTAKPGLQNSSTLYHQAHPGMPEIWQVHVCFTYIPPPFYVSIIFVTSLNDVMIFCFPFPAGKCCTCTEELCWLICAPAGIPTGCSFIATHGPTHQFCIPNFKPVTYILIFIVYRCTLYYT